MIAWKFLATGRVAPFRGVVWPEPGTWLSGSIHACSLADLPFWIDDELWKVELEGDVQRSRRQLVASRGRLLSRIEEWPAAREAFGRACAERTLVRVVEAVRGEGLSAAAERLAAARDFDTLRDVGFALAQAGVVAAGYVFDVVRRIPFAGLCAYNAANGAALTGGRAAHDDERAAQAAWLVEHLRLH